ncbi:MAG TPA: tetratricopeptide repeat protein, partial [Steroidobacteraceae bacterium]|nr:tetratricopeptide repeat protein [Steroidobacteraceae bacterium]
AELMHDGKFQDAERVYREDLERHPDNGWALFGLQQALKAEGRVAEAHAAAARFREAWRHATISIGATAF